MVSNPVRRSRKRSLRKKSLLPRIVIIVLCVALLACLGIYYIQRYQRDLVYSQYPLSYKELIVKTAAEYELMPWHVAAVIRCESSFNPNATSNVGACGLMQIMPDTGLWLAGKFDEKDGFQTENLYDPETNLKYGCWFLNWLMQLYDGDVVLATAAYHAGHGCVNGWLADAAVSPDGKTIDPEAIPYQSTATYVKRILKAYEKYEELYDYET